MLGTTSGARWRPLTDSKVTTARASDSSVNKARDRLDQAATHVFAAGVALTAIADQGYQVHAHAEVGSWLEFEHSD